LHERKGPTGRFTAKKRHLSRGTTTRETEKINQEGQKKKQVALKKEEEKRDGRNRGKKEKGTQELKGGRVLPRVNWEKEKKIARE